MDAFFSLFFDLCVMVAFGALTLGVVVAVAGFVVAMFRFMKD